MKKFLLIGVPCILMAVLVGTLWLNRTRHDDAFDSRNLLLADASALTRTVVSAHLESPIDGSSSVLWCGTFQLTWNEICTLLGEDVHIASGDPQIVTVLNKKSFARDHLDEASFVALADFVGNGIVQRIPVELLRKFGGKASPRFQPSLSESSGPSDIVAYSYLFKNLEFEVVFERIEEPLVFGDAPVACFGIGEPYKSGHTAMYPQVLILDYQSPDDFVIELRTKSEGDRLILAKTQPKGSVGETVEAVENRMARADAIPASSGDVLKVPKLNFDITRHYRELTGLQLAVANQAVPPGSQIRIASQNIRFQLDEEGAKLKSEAHISIGCSASPRPEHIMVFDRPFLLMLQRADAPTPYFALWVANAEVLVGSR